MRVEQEKVEQFHEKMGAPIAHLPMMPDRDLRELRLDLLREEVDELEDAGDAGDIVQVADALADIAYVLLGTAITYGIDLQPIFDEVHRSNMTKDKLDPITKKGGKGPSYEPPRIAALLLMQKTRLDNAMSAL